MWQSNWTIMTSRSYSKNRRAFMELIKRQVQTQWSGKPVVDQFLIDSDYNVPDNRKDIRKIMLSEGELKPEEIKRADKYIKVQGKLLFRILYVTDEADEKIAELSGQIPFEEMVYSEEEKGEWVPRSNRTDVTATMIHSRKLNIRTMAELVLVPEERENREITEDVEGIADSMKKKESRKILTVQNVIRDTYRIKEELKLPKGKDNIASLLWTDIKPQRLDTKLVQDGLIASGELLVFCFYETPDETLNWIEETVSYEGRIPCPGADETMFHQIYTKFTDETAEPRLDEDGEMRAIGMEVTLEVRAAVYEEREQEFLRDMYSLTQDITMDTKKEEYEQVVMQNHLKCSIHETLSLPELKDNIFQICHTGGTMEIVRTEAEEKGIRVEGILHICFLYVKPDDSIPFDTWQGMVPFSCLLECPEIGPHIRCFVDGYPEQITVSLLGGGKAEVKASAAFRAFVRKPEEVNLIVNAEAVPKSMEDIEGRPGIVGYIVKEGEDLFDLAKRYGTTEESIREVNGLKDEELKAGERILIFRENMSIL